MEWQNGWVSQGTLDPSHHGLEHLSFMPCLFTGASEMRLTQTIYPGDFASTSSRECFPEDSVGFDKDGGRKKKVSYLSPTLNFQVQPWHLLSWFYCMIYTGLLTCWASIKVKGSTRRPWVAEPGLCLPYLARDPGKTSVPSLFGNIKTAISIPLNRSREFSVWLLGSLYWEQRLKGCYGLQALWAVLEAACSSFPGNFQCSHWIDHISIYSTWTFE